MPESLLPALELSELDVHYGFVKALHGVEFHVLPGEVVGLVGDNGAGKSTLLKVSSGAISPTEGTVRRSGERLRFSSPSDAAAAGVQMVYQDLALVDPLDVATNMCLGREIVRRGPLGLLGVLDRRAMRREAVSELTALGATIRHVGRPVEMLSRGQRQLVALARAAVRVSGTPDGVLLLDEPTASLGHEQTQKLRALIRQLADRGLAIVLVTHDLPLCLGVAQRIVVLSRGRKVADVPVADTNQEAIIGWITGARAPQYGLLGHARRPDAGTATADRRN
jgi:simple sugar transport system ATP-binding protein